MLEHASCGFSSRGELKVGAHDIPRVDLLLITILCLYVVKFLKLAARGFVIIAVLQPWPAAAGAGAGASITSVLAYLLSAPLARQDHCEPCVHTQAVYDQQPEPGFADDLHRLRSALLVLPLDYLICILIGLVFSLLLDIYQILKVLLSQSRSNSQSVRRPEHLTLDVTRGR